MYSSEKNKPCHQPRYRTRHTRRTRIPTRALVAIAAAILTSCADTAIRSQPDSALVPGKGVSVYAAGDIADCRNGPPESSGAARTADLIASRLAVDSEAVVLSLGDNTYPVGALKEFSHCYEPTWGKFRARTYPTPGNHEYATPKASGYYDYFGAAAGPDRRGYYSFRIGSWHVVSLNSALKGAERQAQLDWLKTDLERNNTRCTLAYWHHPRYSSGGHGDNAYMADVWAVLQAAHADLVLAGHDHNYERFAPQDANGRRDDTRGIRQFVVGTGGARLTPLSSQRVHSEASDNLAHGVLRLQLKDSGYEWEFLPVTSDGFTDRGSARCH